MQVLENIRAVLSRISRSKKGRLVCPKCGNPHVKASSWMDGWLTPMQYLCETCGYRGPVLKLEESLEEDGENSGKTG